MAYSAAKFGCQIMRDGFNTYLDQVELHRKAFQCFALAFGALVILIAFAHVWMFLAVTIPALALPLKLMSYHAGAAGIFCFAWWTIVAVDNMP